MQHRKKRKAQALVGEISEESKAKLRERGTLTEVDMLWILDVVKQMVEKGSNTHQDKPKEKSLDPQRRSSLAPIYDLKSEASFTSPFKNQKLSSNLKSVRSSVTFRELKLVWWLLIEFQNLSYRTQLSRCPHTDLESILVVIYPLNYLEDGRNTTLETQKSRNFPSKTSLDLTNSRSRPRMLPSLRPNFRPDTKVSFIIPKLKR